MQIRAPPFVLFSLGWINELNPLCSTTMPTVDKSKTGLNQL